MNFIMELNNMSISMYILKLFFISISAYYIALKILNKDKEQINKMIIVSVLVFIASIISGITKFLSNSLNSMIVMVLSLSLIFTKMKKDDMGYAIVIMTISLSINYSLFFLAMAIGFIPAFILNIEDVFINFVLILGVYILLTFSFFKIRRLKQGFLFLQRKIKNEYFDILILNISVIILFSFIILSNYNKIFTAKLIFGLLFFSIIMFVTIQKSLQLYYKQKLLIQDLEETKKELENKKQEIEELEKENLNFSKTSHSLAHKQKSLEYKINQLLTNSETASEIDIRDRVNNLSKEIYKEAETVQLSKTEIPEIDDMLEYMQSECIKNKIEFELQINGNIHYMVNNLISKKDLEILIADHIKNAIIAINHSNNINRSILVKIGKIDNIYSLYIYDSGIEFEKETLSKLGKEPSTTYREEGGTGMGFMNTFDTLEKYEASLIINEYNKPSPDNYTKSIVIKFDKNKEFKIKSYRE